MMNFKRSYFNLIGMEKISVFIQEIYKIYPITKSHLKTVILFIGMVSFDQYTLEDPFLISAIEPVAEDGMQLNKKSNYLHGFESKNSRLQYLKSMNTSIITRIVSTPAIMTMRVILRQMYPIHLAR